MKWGQAMNVRLIIPLAAAFVLLVLAAGCEDGLNEEKAETLIHEELVRQMNAGELDWKRFPVVKINTSSNRASLDNFPDGLKRWFYDSGFVMKGRGVPYDVVTPSGLEYMESAPSIIVSIDEINSSSGRIRERSYTFYTHTIDEIEFVGYRDLGNETYEVTYTPLFKRVNDAYMKHVPHWSGPVPDRTMVITKHDEEWKIQAGQF